MIPVVRSDHADELIAAVQELGWLSEHSVSRRWPHNAVLERATRTLQKLEGHFLHLQTGFATHRDLWIHSIG